jgi:tetratricopeptide (TPR) repeat protein
MTKVRIALVAVALLLILVLFKLPKSVVDSDRQAILDSAANPAHVPVSSELETSITELRAIVNSGSPNEKNIIFADSLADLYADAGQFDSAARYAERVATFSKSTAALTKAGDMYYQAYTFAMDAQKQQEMAEKARGYYSEVLAADSSNLTVKSKLAMTYLSSSTPMQGILLLREVLAQDPKNEAALFNLGMLSIQSGQHENAVLRFTELIEVNPQHVQGHLLLGVALMNLGRKEEARAEFERVKELDSDPAVLATVESYLKDLK